MIERQKGNNNSDDHNKERCHAMERSINDHRGRSFRDRNIAFQHINPHGVSTHEIHWGQHINGFSRNFDAEKFCETNFPCGSFEKLIPSVCVEEVPEKTDAEEREKSPANHPNVEHNCFETNLLNEKK